MTDNEKPKSGKTDINSLANRVRDVVKELSPDTPLFEIAPYEPVYRQRRDNAGAKFNTSPTEQVRRQLEQLPGKERGLVASAFRNAHWAGISTINDARNKTTGWENANSWEMPRGIGKAKGRLLRRIFQEEDPTE